MTSNLSHMTRIYSNYNSKWIGFLNRYDWNHTRNMFKFLIFNHFSDDLLLSPTIWPKRLCNKHKRSKISWILLYILVKDIWRLGFKAQHFYSEFLELYFVFLNFPHLFWNFFKIFLEVMELGLLMG